MAKWAPSSMVDVRSSVTMDGSPAGRKRTELGKTSFGISLAPNCGQAVGGPAPDITHYGACLTASLAKIGARESSDLIRTSLADDVLEPFSASRLEPRWQRTIPLRSLAAADVPWPFATQASGACHACQANPHTTSPQFSCADPGSLGYALVTRSSPRWPPVP